MNTVEFPSSSRSAEADTRLLQRYRGSRQLSLDLAGVLSDEDQTVQATEDASPTKWHLGHTTWFYEAFVLRDRLAGYKSYSPHFDYCFNSYYETEGQRQPRARRGVLSRPSAQDVRAWRGYVDEAMVRLLQEGGRGRRDVHALVELGINHEQQHQELLLMDILALFAANPLRPAYMQQAPQGQAADTAADRPLTWTAFDGGIVAIGHDGERFCYDNETPRHQALVHPFRLADRLVTNAEWLHFIADGGYRDPLLWLADGWAKVNGEAWEAPGYWEQVDGYWHQMTLGGLLPVVPAAPVCHVSYYEADAFARWAGKRLPSEFEWEMAVAGDGDGTGLGRGRRDLFPMPAGADDGSDSRQMFGQVWQWTASAYLPYPGFRPPAGAIGEYNGKFMCSQHVLRGSSFATPEGHARKTYRNFFYPNQRWQFAGLRLAEDQT